MVEAGLECERDEHDGLIVYRAAARGRAGAGLLFRVGQADETLARRGLTHLVEHLILSPAHRWTGVSGRVDVLTTGLWFEGEPARVRTLVQDAAAALCDPPTDRLDVERRVLAVEDSRGGAPQTVLLGLWYGARGPGLAAYEEFGLRGARAEDVVAHARHWFGRENAALVLVGDAEIDPGSLRLPDGPRRPTAPAPERSYDPLPAEVPQPHSPLALGAPLPDRPETTLVAALLERRAWTALREERGLAYDVRCRAEKVAADLRLLILVTDVEARDASPAAKVLVDEVRRIARGEFTATELEAVRGDAEQAILAAPPLAPLSLAAGAELVRGRVRLPNEALEDWRRVTRDDVVQVAETLAATMLLACPEGATSSLLPAIDLFAAPPVEGRRFATRTIPRHTVPLEVIVADEGVSMVLGVGAHATVRYATCVAAVRQIDGGITLVDESGDTVRLDPGDLRDGAQAVAAVEAKLDPALIVPVDDRVARVQASPGRRLRPAMVGEAPELLAERLGADEQLLLTAESTLGIRSGVLAVTEGRLLFVSKLLAEHAQEIPLGAVRRLRRKANPLWPTLVVEHGAGKTKFVFLTVRRMNEVADAISSARAA